MYVNVNYHMLYFLLVTFAVIVPDIDICTAWSCGTKCT